MKKGKNTGKINVRLATAKDIHVLFNMAKNDLGKYNWFHESSLLKNLREEPKLCFVMEHENGLGGALFFRQEWGDVVWGWLIFLDAHLRRHGLAAQFQNKVFKGLKKKNYSILYVEVNEDNKHMIRWCKKNNYRKICRFPDWFGKGKHALIFRKDIK